MRQDLPNDLRPRIWGNKEILGKYLIWVETYPNAQSPFQKLNFGSSSQKTCKGRYQTFFVLSSFTGFLCSVPNILRRIVWGNKFLELTLPSFLPTLRLWYFVCYQSISPIFNENIKEVSSITIPSLRVLSKQCFACSVYIKHYSLYLSLTIIAAFLAELTFLNVMSVFSGNQNHRWRCRDQNKNFRTIMIIISWNFTIFHYKPNWPQVKRNLVSSIANLVYQMPCEFPNVLRLRILGNKEI